MKMTSGQADASGSLTAAGLSPEQDRIYRALIQRPNTTATQIADLTGLSPRVCKEALAGLEDSGLVSRRPGRGVRFVPAPPDLAVDALIQRRQQELEAVRLTAAVLANEFRGSSRARSANEIVEIVTGRQAIAHRVIQLEESAKQEILMFDRPPYATEGGPNTSELGVLRRGVAWRAIYDPSSFEVSWVLEEARTLARAGEQARVAAVPLKLMVADRRTGLIALNIEDPDLEGALVVHSSPVLDALVWLFDLVWERAAKVDFAADGGLEHAEDEHPAISSQDRTLLTLLATGLQDQAIARQLNISLRTVRRRVGKLMTAFGTGTRFQAGMEATKKSLI